MQKRESESRAPTSFVVMMALMSAIVALSIDMMLPALGEIATELGSTDDNDRQLVLSVLFLGLACAQIFYGPLADRYGRKAPLALGMALFIVGCLISLFAQSMAVLLLGRFIQGVGAAGPRIICNAIVRDRYSGNTMASVVSLIMMVFILVPVIAPMIGQVVIMFSHWRVIFVIFIVLGGSMLIWFWLRQDETLPSNQRIPLSPQRLWRVFTEVLTTRQSIGYTLAAAVIFGAFLGFLNSAQQILQELYGLGDRFPLFFAILALAFGVASYFNSRLVFRFGMRRMTNWGIRGLCVTTALFLVMAVAADPLPLWLFMAFQLMIFFLIGLLFGNFSALALEPVGHIAGSASAVIGSVTTMVSLIIGASIGIAYNETVVPLVLGFTLTSIVAYLIVVWTERGNATTSA